MDIWVRSQDKFRFENVRSLYCVERLGTIGTAEKSQFIVYCNDHVELGKYATPERCLEILDEFQNLLKQSNATVLFYAELPQSVEEQKEIVENLKNGVIYVDETNNKALIDRYSTEIIIFEMPKE